MYNEDTNTMSSCATVPDPRDINDPDYDVVEEDSQDYDEEPITKGPSNFMPKLTELAPEIARADVGTETLAKCLTAFAEDLFNAGLLKERIIITRGKLESNKDIDGNIRLLGLAMLKVFGMYIIYNLINIIII